MGDSGEETGADQEGGGESECAAVCTLEPDGGPCARYGKKVRRWAFYSEEKECKPLYYGGCKGNANRFWKKTECEAKCQDCMNANEISTSTSASTSTSKENQKPNT